MGDKGRNTGRTAGKQNRNCIDDDVTKNTRGDRPTHKTNHKDKKQLERAGRNTRQQVNTITQAGKLKDRK